MEHWKAKGRQRQGQHPASAIGTIDVSTRKVTTIELEVKNLTWRFEKKTSTFFVFLRFFPLCVSQSWSLGIKVQNVKEVISKASESRGTSGHLDIWLATVDGRNPATWDVKQKYIYISI